MFLPCLHTAGRNNPQPLLKIKFIPSRFQHFTRATHTTSSGSSQPLAPNEIDTALRTIEEAAGVDIESSPIHEGEPLILITVAADPLPEDEGFSAPDFDFGDFINVQAEPVEQLPGFSNPDLGIDTTVLANEDASNIPSRDELISSLPAGARITEDNVVTIFTTDDGRTVWLETGDSGSGLQHIEERHTSDFEQIGIQQSEIPEFIQQGLTDGNQIGINNGEPVYLAGNRPVTIVVGSNGYIVTAYPSSEFERF